MFERIQQPTTATTEFITWLFLFLDSSLSGGYLLLFVMPVVIHMRKMKSISPGTIKESGSAEGQEVDPIK
jgi:hypothetical protein